MFFKRDARATWLYPIFAFVVGLLLLDAVLLANDLRRAFNQQHQMLLAYDRIEHLDHLLAYLAAAEAEQFAYVLSNSVDYRDRHDTAIDGAREHQRALRRLYAAEGDSLAALVDRLADSTIVRMGEPVRLYAQGDISDALTQVATDSTRLYALAAREAIVALREREQGQIDTAREIRSESEERVVAMFLITTIVSLGLIALLYLFVARDMRHRVRIERTLRKHRDELDNRVQARTQELLEANATLRQSIEALARSNQELEEFSYVASHDLQEPLRKIRVFGGLLISQEQDRLSDEGRTYLDRMHQAAVRMSNLINDLLMYSRVRSRQEPFTPVDLNLLLREVLTDLDVALTEAGAQVEVGQLPAIEGDAAQLRQMLRHLIGNALKFRRPDVPCLVQIEADTIELDGSAHHRICIHDNGIGFEPRFAERIFKPFQQLHGKFEYPGTGIGLAVCRRIAERHGALLTARSEPGAGTTFCLTLPTTPVRMAHAEHMQA